MNYLQGDLSFGDKGEDFYSEGVYFYDSPSEEFGLHSVLFQCDENSGFGLFVLYFEWKIRLEGNWIQAVVRVPYTLVECTNKLSFEEIKKLSKSAIENAVKFLNFEFEKRKITIMPRDTKDIDEAQLYSILDKSVHWGISGALSLCI